MKNKRNLDIKYFKISDVVNINDNIMYIILEHLKHISKNYPDFQKWFENIIIPEIKIGDGRREIIIAISKLNDKSKYIITGIAILKRNDNQKKICTIEVNKDYRGQGIGSRLFEYCFNYLETTSPIFSISETKIKEFQYFIDKYNFELCEVLHSKYIQGENEYVYNGKL